MRILKVTAKDKNTGKEQNISIQGSSGLSKEEIERAKKDAEMHAEEDRKKAEDIEAINKADSLAHRKKTTIPNNKSTNMVLMLEVMNCILKKEPDLLTLSNFIPNLLQNNK